VTVPSVILAAVVVAAGAAGPGLPGGAARYQMVLAGEAVGVAALAVACEGQSGPCALRWETWLRLPVEAGGGVRTRRLAVPVRPDGRALARAAVAVDGLEALGPALPPEVFPASALELVLSQGEARCVPAGDEETGRSGTACVAAGAGGARRITFLGVEEQVEAGADGFPERVEIPAQRVTYLRDAAAAVPARVTLTVRVAGPADPALARRFCRLEPDPPSPAPEPEREALPPARPGVGSCQAQAAAYAASARRRGLATRIAVGVAHDGQGFLWHAWTEVRAAGGWVVVDPAFGQVPAQGPRFTVARHGGDAGSVREAGRRILECWGRSVE